MSDHAGTGGVRLSWMLCLAAPTTWVLHLLVLYAGHALICARAGAEAAKAWPWLATTAGIIALGALAAIATFAHQRYGKGFARNAALAIAVLSLLGVVWTTMTAAIIPACGP